MMDTSAATLIGLAVVFVSVLCVLLAFKCGRDWLLIPPAAL